MWESKSHVISKPSASAVSHWAMRAGVAGATIPKRMGSLLTCRESIHNREQLRLHSRVCQDSAKAQVRSQRPGRENNGYVGRAAGSGVEGASSSTGGGV